MSIRNTIKDYRPSVFEVCLKRNTHGVTEYLGKGTGFLIADDLVVTCDHVVDGVPDTDLGIRYHLNVNNEVAAGHYGISAVHRFPADDLALLEVNKVLGMPHRAFSLGVNSDVEVGEEVYSAGYPLGDSIQSTSETRVCFVSRGVMAGEATDVIGGDPPQDMRRNLILDITAHPGCSGAPVFLPNGTVVGVLNAGHPVYAATEENGAACERIGIGHAVAIPVDHLRARVDEVKSGPAN